MIILLIPLLAIVLIVPACFIKNPVVKLIFRILLTLVTAVLTVICIFIDVIMCNALGGVTKYLNCLSWSTSIGLVFLALLFLVFVWGLYKKKKWLLSVCIPLTFCLLATGGILALRAYDAGIATVSANDDLSKYNPASADNKLIHSDKAPSLQLSGSYPVMDGATALYPVYASFGVNLYPETLVGSYTKSEYVRCTKTADAYTNLIAGNCDIIFVASPSKEQSAAAEQLGVKLVFTPIGREGFVFFVNSRNPLNDITSDDLRRIYSGQLTKWSQLGVRGLGDIRPFQRKENSGSQTYLEKFMGDTPIIEAEKTQITEFMEGIITKVADYKNYKNAIGFSFRFYATEMVQNDQIKLLSVDGVAPTRENIANGTYPLSGDFYAVTRSDCSEETKALVDWILSEEGQSIIEQVGYTGIR